MIRQQFRILKTAPYFTAFGQKILDDYQKTLKNAKPLKYQMLKSFKEVLVKGKIDIYKIDVALNQFEKELTNIQQRQPNVKT